MGDRERRSPSPIRPRGTGQPIQRVIAEILIAIDRIRDEIYIPIGGKGIGEILVEEIRSLLGLERTELETISRHTGRLDWQRCWS